VFVIAKDPTHTNSLVTKAADVNEWSSRQPQHADGRHTALKLQE
jgi:hypothetical protein